MNRWAEDPGHYVMIQGGGSRTDESLIGILDLANARVLELKRFPTRDRIRIDAVRLDATQFACVVRNQAAKREWVLYWSLP